MYQPNLVAVLVAGIIPMVVGSIWYGPLFGKMWMKMIGKTEEELRESMSPIKMYVVTFVFALVMAYVLAHVLQAFADAYAVTGLVAGLQGAFWMWLGFLLTTSYQAVAFEDKKITMDELCDALDKNFEGCDELRQTLLRAPKFGNDDEYADEQTAFVSHVYASEMTKHKNTRGGHCCPGGSPLSAAASCR